MNENSMTQKDSSQRQILKATGIVGGAQVISILLRVVRTKIIAVLLGPAGVGVAGLYQSVLDIVRSTTGLGLDFSAVRDIAEADSQSDKGKAGRVVAILRRWVWFTGLFGTVSLFMLSGLLSKYTFKDSLHLSEFRLLSIVPMFVAICGGQMALLRGMRRISDIARASVLGVAAGTLITLPLYWLMGVSGIVYGLVLSALAELCLSWFFSRRIKIVKVHLSLADTISGGAGMIKLGIFTVVAGLAMTGTMYLERIIIANRLGVDGVGQFQAAWNLSSNYVGLALGAMATDYFPRLSAVHKENIKVTKLANEQVQIALLLAGPLIIGMLCFFDVVTKVFYSDKFSQGSLILLWQMVGNLPKIMSWTLGFIFLSKSNGGLFIFSEFLWDVLFLLITWVFWDRIGFEVTGIAFAIACLVSAGVRFLLCNRIYSFSWTRGSMKYFLVYSGLAILSFINVKLRIFSYWRVVSIFIFTASSIFSYRELNKVHNIKELFLKLLVKVGLSTKDKSA